MRHSIYAIALATLGLLGAASAARAQTVFANFEDGTTDGFGTFTNTGVTANTFSAPTAGAVITPGSGGDTTKVFDFTAPGYNGGVNSSTVGSDLGYDFVPNGFLAQFLANDVITFQWEVAPGTESSGYAQFYNIILNGPGAGYHTVGGSAGTTDTALATVTGTVNQYPGFSGQVNTVSINYDGFKAALTANPSYVQFGFQTNDANPPSDFYFDNFTLSAVPEPASLGVAAIGGLALLRRRRAV